MTNKQKFITCLTAKNKELYKLPAYALAAQKASPEEGAEKMVAALQDGMAQITGEGVKHVCKELGIKHRLSAIKEYLNS